MNNSGHTMFFTSHQLLHKSTVIELNCYRLKLHHGIDINLIIDAIKSNTE